MSTRALLLPVLPSVAYDSVDVLVPQLFAVQLSGVTPCPLVSNDALAIRLLPAAWAWLDSGVAAANSTTTAHRQLKILFTRTPHFDYGRQANIIYYILD